MILRYDEHTGFFISKEAYVNRYLPCLPNVSQLETQWEELPILRRVTVSNSTLKVGDIIAYSVDSAGNITTATISAISDVSFNENLQDKYVILDFHNQSSKVAYLDGNSTIYVDSKEWWR